MLIKLNIQRPHKKRLWAVISVEVSITLTPIIAMYLSALIMSATIYK